MKYFVPDLTLAGQLPVQTRLEEKLGGLPWGLPAERWPLCAACGKPQSLLAQFIHHPERLDLGAPGRVLLVFQCNYDPGSCETWAAGSGANACFVLDAAELTTELTAPPDADMPLELEARVTGWIEKEDGIPPELYPLCFTDDMLVELPHKQLESVAACTKLGGVPAWQQSASEGPRDGRFLGQLDCLYSFYSPAPLPASVGLPAVSVDKQHLAGRNWTVQGPDFGDCGMAYLFLTDPPEAPQGWFFWQCG